MYIYHISMYGDNKLIAEFTKPRSPYSVKIVQDKDDDWFYYVLTYKKKSGEIKHSSMIIGSDIEVWTEYVQSLGYVLKK